MELRASIAREFSSIQGALPQGGRRWKVRVQWFNRLRDLKLRVAAGAAHDFACMLGFSFELHVTGGAFKLHLVSFWMGLRSEKRMVLRLFRFRGFDQSIVSNLSSGFAPIVRRLICAAKA
jgi:hypothetical protein